MLDDIVWIIVLRMSQCMMIVLYKERKEDSDNGIQYRRLHGKKRWDFLITEWRIGREDTTGFMSIISESLCLSVLVLFFIYIPPLYTISDCFVSNFAEPAASL